MVPLGIFLAPVFLGYLAGLGAASWALGAVVFGTWYAHDVRRHNRVRCRACTGSGEKNSRLGGGKWFRVPFGNCWCCGGKQSHPRLALRIIDPAAYRRIRNEVRQAKGKT